MIYYVQPLSKLSSSCYKMSSLITKVKKRYTTLLRTKIWEKNSLMSGQKGPVEEPRWQWLQSGVIVYSTQIDRSPGQIGLSDLPPFTNDFASHTRTEGSISFHEKEVDGPSIVPFCSFTRKIGTESKNGWKANWGSCVSESGLSLIS